MKAVVQDRYGPPDEVLRLREIPTPVPGDGEVLVRVRAASVHPDVWHAVTGRPYALRLMGAGLLKPNDRVPGTDLAGEVVAAGKDVRRLKAGDEVFGDRFEQLQWRNGGTFAEYAAVSEKTLALKPGGISFEQASVLPTAGMIALHNLRREFVKPGGRVLINGAGGGVGSIALQLARAWGAHVTGIDGPDKLDLLRELGASRVIDYTREDFTQGDFTRPGERYDLILDVASTLSLARCRRALTPAGAYVFIGHDHFGRRAGRVLGSLPRAIKLLALSRLSRRLPKATSPPPGIQDGLALLRELLESGQLTPVVARSFPLDQVPEALRCLAQENPAGRIVITP